MTAAIADDDHRATLDRLAIVEALRGNRTDDRAYREVAIARARHQRGELPDHDVVLLEAGDDRHADDPRRFDVVEIGRPPVDVDPDTMAALDHHWGAEHATDEQSDVEDELLASWQPVDLSAALACDKTRPEPTLLRRSDDRHLLYEGQVNYLHGSDGVGKSFVALFAAVEVLEDGGQVVWLDWEDPDETTVVGRLLDLGVAAHVVAEQFHYVHPETEATPSAVSLVCDLVRRHRARLVVVDSVGEAMGVDSVNEDKDNEVTPWLRRVLRPLAARVTPCSPSTTA